MVKIKKIIVLLVILLFIYTVSADTYEDREGDTIYYALSQSALFNMTKQIDFGSCSIMQYCSDITCQILGGILGEDINGQIPACTDKPQDSNNFVYPTDNTCRIDNDGYSTVFNYVNILNNNNYPAVALSMNPSCNGTDKSIYLKLGHYGNFFFYMPDIFDLKSGESIKIAPQDSSFNDITYFNLTRNSTMLMIIDSNNNIIGNYSLASNYFGDFFITVFGFRDNQMTIRVASSNLSNQDLITSVINVTQSSLVNYVQLQLGYNTNVVIDYINYGVSWQSPNFVTTPPTQITFTGSQPNANYLIYVTDSSHLNTGEFLTNAISFSVRATSDSICSICFSA